MTPRANRHSLQILTVTAVFFVVLGSLPAPAQSRITPLAQPTRGQRGTAPHVVYSTLLGGAEGNYDGASDVTVDAGGNAVVVGQTESSDFPTRNALQDSLEGNSDAFVAKFAPDGTLLFSTFLGGDENDSAAAVAVDASGAIYVGGSTNSDDFPIKNAYQSTRSAFTDAFVTKLSPDGSTIVWSTYLGGNGTDDVKDLTIDASGRVFVAGEVMPVSGGSATFPTVNAVQPAYAGGSSDTFVSLLSADGHELVASTLLDMRQRSGTGAPGRDVVFAVRVLPGRSDVFVSGSAESADENEEDDLAFIARLGVPDAKQHGPQIFFELLFGAYPQVREALRHPELRGWKLTRGMLLRYPDAISDTPGPRRGADEEIVMIAEGLCHPGPNGRCDDINSLVRYAPDLDETEFANLSLLNEFFVDFPSVDAHGAVYIAGDLFADRLTAVNPFQPEYGGNDDAVVAVLAPGTLEPAMVSFLGGDGFDTPTGITTDADGNIFVAGLTTLSTVFPTTPGAFQSMPKGRNDAFLVKISPVGPFPDAPDFSLSFDPVTIQVSRGSKVSVPLLIERVGGFTGNVKITPPAQVPGFKSPKKKPTVPGDSTVLKFKIKADAPLGPTSFTFTGTDPDGRVRSATVTLDVQ